MLIFIENLNNFFRYRHLICIGIDKKCTSLLPPHSLPDSESFGCAINYDLHVARSCVVRYTINSECSDSELNLW